MNAVAAANVASANVSRIVAMFINAIMVLLAYAREIAARQSLAAAEEQRGMVRQLLDVLAESPPDLVAAASTANIPVDTSALSSLVYPTTAPTPGMQLPSGMSPIPHPGATGSSATGHAG
jgi:hypothetical protein